MDQKERVILWDFDIVWVEELERILKEQDVVCEEADSWEELQEKIEKQEVLSLCVVSEETIKEVFSTVEEALNALREKITIPIVLILDKDDTEVELMALKAGVWDVLMKEREVEIAAERIILLIRKKAVHVQTDGVMKGERRTAIQEDFLREFSKIHFTILEKKVMYEMYRRKNQVISRQEFIDKFWKEREGEEKRVVDTVIKQLRKKLKGTSYEIQGVYGQGYLLKK